MQDCGISLVNTLEILQSCTKQSICKLSDEQGRLSFYTRMALEEVKVAYKYNIMSVSAQVTRWLS